MEEKRKSPIVPIVITIIIGLSVIIGSILYERANQIEEWVVCTYHGDIQGYEETLKFRFMYDQFYGYYEERSIEAINELEKAELLKQMEDFGKDFEQSEILEYKITEDGVKVFSKLYIKALPYYEFLNEYFKENNVSIESKPIDIVNAFKDNYKCTRTRK